MLITFHIHASATTLSAEMSYQTQPWVLTHMAMMFDEHNLSAS